MLSMKPKMPEINTKLKGNGTANIVDMSDHQLTKWQGEWI